MKDHPVHLSAEQRPAAGWSDRPRYSGDTA
jgi:hypothetical protein